MPIPDEAREALTGAFSFESSRGNVDHRPGYYVNRVDSVLTANGYTVVKLPTVAELDAAIDKAFGPHDHTAEFCDGCTAGEMVLSLLGVRSLPLGDGAANAHQPVPGVTSAAEPNVAGYVPLPDERALERTIHNSICPCDAYVNPMAPDSCAGERTMAMATARRAVLALLRGEGQTDG